MMTEKVLGIEGELLDSYNNPQVKLGLIGCGSHAYRNILPCIQFLPVTIKATCDLNIEKAKLYAKRFGDTDYYNDYREMIQKTQLDGVVVVLGYDDFGRPRYPEIVPDILKLGIPVWMEKPPAASAKQVEEMKEAMEIGQTFFQVGFKKMFMPALQKMKQIMSSDSFGEIVSYTCRYPVDLPVNTMDLVYGDSRRFIDDFVHVASTIVYLVGKPREIIHYRNHLNGGFAVLFHECGIIGTVHFANGASQIAPLERIEVIGEGEHLVLDNNIQLKYYKKGFIGPYGRTTSFIPVEGEAIEYSPEFSLGQLYNKGLFLLGYYGELKEFVDCILEKRHPYNAHAQDAIDVMKIIDAFAHGPNERVILGTPLPKQNIPSKPEILVCPFCDYGKLVLKDGWNYNCRDCGRTINEKMLKNKLLAKENDNGVKSHDLFS